VRRLGSRRELYWRRRFSMKWCGAIVLCVLLSLAGCDRSTDEAINDYCHGRITCWVDEPSSDALESCLDTYATPEGDAHEQCAERAKAACLGNCYDDRGCGIFDVNDPCGCSRADRGCPQ
jgi:hypothetical protein